MSSAAPEDEAELILRAEFELEDADRKAIARLLDRCFPDVFEGRIYFKQLPRLRILAACDGELRGQVGLEHRVIRIGAKYFPIFGLIDLCVAEHCRRRGLGGRLLTAVEELARRSGIPFLVLMADDHRLYRAHGYRLLNVDVTWYVIEDRESFGVVRRNLGGCFMAKPVGDTAWPEGAVDLLGYLF